MVTTITRTATFARLTALTAVTHGVRGRHHLVDRMQLVAAEIGHRIVDGKPIVVVGRDTELRLQLLNAVLQSLLTGRFDLHQLLQLPKEPSGQSEDPQKSLCLYSLDEIHCQTQHRTLAQSLRQRRLFDRLAASSSATVPLFALHSFILFLLDLDLSCGERVGDHLGR